MTLRKKLLITIACLSVILCTLVTGTVAWLMDTTDTVTNTFTPSDINITLEESGAQNNQQDFKMIPGTTIAKDPKVTVKAGSEACWLFVKVEEKGGNVTVEGTAYTFADFIDYEMADGWTKLSDVDGVYYRTVDASSKSMEFYILKGKDDYENGCVTVSPDVAKAMMNALTAENYPTLTFTAYAIQKEGMDDAADAWKKINADTNNSASTDPTT